MHIPEEGHLNSAFHTAAHEIANKANASVLIGTGATAGIGKFIEYMCSAVAQNPGFAHLAAGEVKHLTGYIVACAFSAFTGAVTISAHDFYKKYVAAYKKEAKKSRQVIPISEGRKLGSRQSGKSQPKLMPRHKVVAINAPKRPLAVSRPNTGDRAALKPAVGE